MNLTFRWGISIFALFLFAILCYSCDTEENVSPLDIAISPALSPFAVGDVTPEGWLLDWAQMAAQGITGHLDERTATFEKGWSGESFEARGVREEGTNWPLEQSAYWLDGLVRLAYILKDEYLINKVKSRLDPVVDGVLNGGPSFIYWRQIDQLEQTFDNWAHSHMGRAMVAYYSATKEIRILKALEKVYENYPLPEMNPNFYDVNGSVNIDPMLDTYMLGGNKKVKETALAFTNRMDFKNVVDKWNQDSLNVGHTVIYYENIRVPAIGYLLSGRKEHLNASLSALRWAENDHLLPQGLVSGEEYLAGIGPARNIETCNVAAGAWTLNWLQRITGEREYADRIEKIFFNAGPVPLSRDFQTMSYYQCANRIRADLPGDRPHHPSTDMDSYFYRDIGHTVLCCVGNSNRIIPNYIMHMWMKSAENGLVALLYGPNVLKTGIRGTAVEIYSATSYPFDERITMTVKTADEIEFPLQLRIPAWCSDPLIRLNGQPISAELEKNGFVTIQRTWKTGDIIVLEFPMSVTVKQGRTTNYADIKYFKKYEHARPIAKTYDKISNPYASIYYGPFLMALPIPDEGANQVGENVPINFALNVNPDNPQADIKIRKNKLSEPWFWQLQNPPLELSVPAVKFNWKPTDMQPLPATPVEGGSETNISLVPYNITKFRVSMFPVTASSWRGEKQN